ncbi:hypothetical protein GGS26DRAFT_601986 [Hypomontagnella submonticulosa]|nr:hypothetical protein GGS26DRAFT_601986 [Hypomontagnella submonticulosa]
MPSPKLPWKYWRYTDDLDYVAIWLATTAKAHGYDLAPSTNPPESSQEAGRLKGKARKQPKEAAHQAGKTPKQRVITILDFIPLAEYIASREPPVSVPEALPAALRRIIQLRDEYDDFLSDCGYDLVNLASNHPEHLLGIIAQVCNVLRPRMSFDRNSAKSQAYAHKPATYVTKYFTDYFTRVGILGSINDRDPPRPELPSQGADAVEYVLEPLISREVALFALFHFYWDIDCLRNYVIDMWHDVFYGHEGVRRPLATAALLSSLSIGIVWDLMQEVTLLCQNYGGIYALTEVLYTSRNTKYSRKYSRDTTETWEPYVLEEMLLIPSFRTLKAFRDTFSGKKSGTVSHKFDPDKEFPLKRSYSEVEKEDFDARLLQWFFAESHLLATNGWGYVAEDEVIKGMRNIGKTQDVPLHLAYAGILFVDVHHYFLEKVTVAFEIMVRELAHMRSELQDYKDFQENSARGTLDRNKSRSRELDDLLKDIDAAVGDPSFDARVKIYKKLGLPVPNRRHDFLRRNPMLCGIILFHLQSRMEQFSLATLNSAPAPIAATHLNNALVRANLLDREWRDVELFVKVFLVPNVFPGGRGLDDLDSCYRGLLLKLGWPVSLSALHEVNVDLKMRKKQRPIPGGVEGLRMFVGKYMPNQNMSPEWTRDYVQSVLETQKKTGIIFGVDSAGYLNFSMHMIGYEEIYGNHWEGPSRNEPLLRLMKLSTVSLQYGNERFVFPTLTLIRMTHVCLEHIREACEPLLEQHLPKYNCGPEPSRFVLWLFHAITGGVKSDALRQEILQAAATAMGAFTTSPHKNEATSRLQRATGLKYNLVPEQYLVPVYTAAPRPSEEQTAQWREWTGRDDIFP